MPLPTPGQNESRPDFMTRCIPEAFKEADSNEQAVAICANQFEGRTMNQIYVNMSAKVDNKTIRHAKRNGRDVIIVPSATLPDNVVMNGIKYTPEFIESVYKTLERSPAPVGHPRFNGVYVNAADPEAQNGFGVGAWNENVRRHNGRVFLDKVIDVEVARNSERGRALLSAIEKKEPIHTSTGLAMKTNAAAGDGYTKIAVSGHCDHDAFLLDEPGAATPDQGVGVFVNSQGERMDVVNADMSEWIDGIAHEMAFEVVDAAERAKRMGMVEKVKAQFVKLFGDVLDSETPPEETVANPGDSDMSITPEQLQAALDKQAETLRTNAKQDTEAAIAAAVQPLQEQLDAVNAETKAAKEAEHAQAVEAVVNAKLMDEAEAKALPLNALNALVKTTKRAAPLAPGAPIYANRDGDQYDHLAGLPKE